MNVQSMAPAIRPQINTAPRPPADADNIEPAAATVEPAETPKTKGVIRLLQEGHFKGVADVRLRINFHEELARMDVQRASEETSVASADFSAGVAEDFNGFIIQSTATEEQAAAAEELFTAFSTTVSTAANEFLKDSNTDFAVVSEQLASESANFAGELQTLLELEPEDSTLVQLSAAFADRVSQLETAAKDFSSLLPELSAPKGNGAAYAKFVEILEGLNTVEVEADTPPRLEDVFA